jgi:hypothetical protein
MVWECTTVGAFHVPAWNKTMIPVAVTVAFSASCAAADKSADLCVASDTFTVGITILVIGNGLLILVNSLCMIDFA